MKLFLDTSDIDVLREYIKTGVIDGVTTNPSNLSKAGNQPRTRIEEITTLFKHGDVSVEVTEQDPAAMYKQALEIAALAPNVVVKIPCHADYYPVIHRLAQEGINMNITLVFTVAQALMMCKLGVRYISPFVGRWDEIDVDGIALLHELRAMVDNYGFSTMILAASLRHVRHLNGAINAGADVATLPPEVFIKALAHPLTDRGIERFNADWAKLGIRQFP